MDPICLAILLMFLNPLELGSVQLKLILTRLISLTFAQLIGKAWAGSVTKAAQGTRSRTLQKQNAVKKQILKEMAGFMVSMSGPFTQTTTLATYCKLWTLLHPTHSEIALQESGISLDPNHVTVNVFINRLASNIFTKLTEKVNTL
jgi:hypothetical protein